MLELVRFLFEKTGYRVGADALVSKVEGGRESITLTLGSEDIQKFSAGDGRLVRSFRALLSAAAAVRETTVVLEVIEGA